MIHKGMDVNYRKFSRCENVDWGARFSRDEQGSKLTHRHKNQSRQNEYSKTMAYNTKVLSDPEMF